MPETIDIPQCLMRSILNIAFTKNLQLATPDVFQSSMYTNTMQYSIMYLQYSIMFYKFNIIIRWMEMECRKRDVLCENNSPQVDHEIGALKLHQ